MNTWKAKITDISEVDGSGHFEVQYMIIHNEVEHSRFGIRVASKQEAEEKIKEKINSIKNAFEEATTLKVGDEITI